jgi:hypothetical protein
MSNKFTGYGLIDQFTVLRDAEYIGIKHRGTEAQRNVSITNLLASVAPYLFCKIQNPAIK